MALKPQNSAKKTVFFPCKQADYSEEGLEKIKSKIHSECSKHFTMSDDPDTPVHVIHTAGFGEIAKKALFGPRKPKMIVSLHSDPTPHFFKTFRDAFQYYWYFYSPSGDIFSFPERFTRSIVHQLMQLIPFSVKRFFLSKADILIVPTKNLAHKFPGSKLICDGVDTNRFKPLPSKRSTITVGYIGHPAIDKGLIEVLNAFSKINDDHLKKIVALSYRNNRMQSAIHKFDSTIEVQGKSNNIVNTYNELDIVVLPYRHIGGAIATPLVLLEAMSCGRTIITSDLPAIKEIAADTVQYCKPYNVDSIVSMIHHATQHPELRKKLGIAARKRVVNFYNEEAMLSSYIELYKGALK